MKFLSALLLFVSIVSGDAITLPDNFRADFMQTITNAKKKTIDYSGKVRFSNRTLLKWEYLEPTKKEVCTDGVELVVVDHDLEQVSTYLINEGFDLAEILKKAKKYKENIYVAEHDNKSYTIQLNGKQQIQSIAYYDDLDNKVQILFKHMKYGKGDLDRKSMQCHYPKTYDMIRG
jgi:outer membrane lipoprotein carrier protein